MLARGIRVTRGSSQEMTVSVGGSSADRTESLQSSSSEQEVRVLAGLAPLWEQASLASGGPTDTEPGRVVAWYSHVSDVALPCTVSLSSPGFSLG